MLANLRDTVTRLPLGLQSVLYVAAPLAIGMLLMGLIAYIMTEVRSTPLVRSVMAAENSVRLTNYDRAYCASGEKFVQKIDTEEVRGVVCWAGAGLLYNGFSKISGNKIRLEATIRGDEVVVANNGGTSYEMTPYGLFVTKNGEAIRPGWTSDIEYRSQNLPLLPGDLGIKDHPISYPDCNGQLVYVYPPILDGPGARAQMERELAQSTHKKYLRTDLSCDNFFMPSQEASEGQYMYAVYEIYEYSSGMQETLCARLRNIPNDNSRVSLAAVDRLQDGVLSHSSACRN